MPSEKKEFITRKEKKSIEFIFPSVVKNIDYACEESTRYLRSEITNIGDQLFAINLVIREGLTNAIRHGNKGDPQKQVRFLLSIKKGPSLFMEIADQGDGFDWKKETGKVPDDDKEHGRGIQIMRMYFDDYVYNEKGNILYLKKNIEP